VSLFLFEELIEGLSIQRTMGIRYQVYLFDKFCSTEANCHCQLPLFFHLEFFLILFKTHRHGGLTGYSVDRFFICGNPRAICVTLREVLAELRRNSAEFR